MGIANLKIVPTCRYGHGQLIRVEPGASTSNPRFGWVSMGNIDQQFVGMLFTCSACGYTEFFDDEPEVTAAEIAERSR